MTAEPARWLGLPRPSSLDLAGGEWRAFRVRVEAEKPLETEASRLREELALLGIPEGDEGRIVLRLVPPEASTEAYRIEVGDDITVRASSPVGAFRATRQLLHNLRAQGFVPRGVIAGSPAVAERGIHLDTGRKHYPASWIEGMLRDAADVGVNVFQWHFSENEGFRLESTAFPDIVSTEHVTRREAARIVELARSLHIDIVPSLDMPGHLGQVLTAFPELRLSAGRAPGATAHTEGPRDDHALDITREESTRFARSLVDDIAPLFAHSSSWHLGGDEFVAFERMEDYPSLAAAARERFGKHATGFDLLTDFVNVVAAHLRTRGFTARVWNDGMLRSSIVPLDADAVLTWWTNWHAEMRPLSDAIRAEHELVNVSDGVMYYVVGENAGYRYPTAERFWEIDWHPGLFPPLRDGQRQEISLPYSSLLKGSMFAVWSDVPSAQSTEDIARGIRAPLRAMSERAWNGGSELSFDDFDHIDRAIGRATRNDSVEECTMR